MPFSIGWATASVMSWNVCVPSISGARRSTGSRLSMAVAMSFTVPSLTSDGVVADEVRVEVAEPPEVAGARLRVQLPQHHVVPGLRLQPADGAVGIAHVAEHDRLRR